VIPAHTLDQLKTLRLDGMVAALSDQAISSAAAELGFDPERHPNSPTFRHLNSPTHGQ